MIISNPSISTREEMLLSVLQAYGISHQAYKIHTIDVGLINQTYLLQDQSGNEQHYILQNINTNVFQQPDFVDHNIRLITTYLQNHFPNKPSLILKKTNEQTTLLSLNGHYYRIFNYFSNAVTHNIVTDPHLAYQAAFAFADFSNSLKDFNVNDLKITIPQFHSLHARAQQLEHAFSQADETRIKQAKNVLQDIAIQKPVIEFSINIPFEHDFIQRVMHHDTKISNILFDQDNKPISVIDLDTCMPGYLFSDLGDMIRTYVCPIHESSKDFDSIHVRKDYLEAIFEGYRAGMPTITELEHQHFTTFGEIMLLMQAIRFMTDFLNNDKYYPISYPEQNLDRAKNQMKLLQELQRI